MEYESHDSSFELDAATARILDTMAAGLGPDTRVSVLSGAGISAASGIPTFRGDGGFWKNFRAEDLATVDGFTNNPEVGWEWYGWRREKIRAAQPNAAHFALVELSSLVRDFGIITQNVDGLHAAAFAERGFESEIVELHGSIWRMRCMRCDHEFEDRRRGPASGELPHCECGGLLRPAVVWFGEALAPESLTSAQAIATRCELFLVVGTSALVYPAASFAAIAKQAGAEVAEFNLEATDLSARMNHAIHAPAEIALPALVARVKKLRKATP